MFFFSQELKKYAFIFIGFIISCFLVYFFYDQFFSIVQNKKQINFEQAFEQSINGSNPETLQNFLVDQIAQGKDTDGATLAAIYWVSHRYFDNGGDIYEIYDFVNTHDEVSFLKEAEEIYPKAFNNIRTTHVEAYSIDSLYGLLGYYEAMDKHGYADIAVWGTAANKYSEIAYYGNIQHDGETEENRTYREKYRDHAIERTKYFLTKIRLFIIENTKKTASLAELRNSGLKDNDILVGLNQYASARQILKGMGVEFFAEFTPIEIFEFNSEFASQYVPRLYFFTNYLYASTMVRVGEVTEDSVKKPLGRLIEYSNQVQPSLRPGSHQRIIDSKINNEYSLFEYAVVKELARVSPDFKRWLEQNGWTANDF